MTLKKCSLLIVCLFFSASGCSAEKQRILSGKTMGTTWRVVIPANEKNIPDDINSRIIQELERINQRMSMFDPESELSRFNDSERGEEPFCGSVGFISLYKVGRELYRLTGGEWDATIGPLVNLWGFGRQNIKIFPPDHHAIQKKLASVGYDTIMMKNDHCLLKKNAGVVLDFGSIAKGYGVDIISELLKKKGLENFLVEIGGEVFGSGENAGKKWRVGIKMPEYLPRSNRLFNVIELKNRAVATSGDYRNFKEADGKKYAHIINPLTGYPVSNNVASVTVTGDNTAVADGLATAVMVMGAVRGIELINSLENTECLIITRTGETFNTRVSNGWENVSSQ